MSPTIRLSVLPQCLVFSLEMFLRAPLTSKCTSNLLAITHCTLTASLTVPSFPSLINNYLHVAAITTLFYDYLVTFDAEATFIWERPKSIGAYSFLINRYFAIVANMIIVIPGIGKNAHSEQVCSFKISFLGRN